MSIVCGLNGLSIGEVLSSSELSTNLAKLVEEHEAITESMGFMLEGDTMTQIKSIPADTITSAARSISSGQSSELDTIYSWAIEREVGLGPETRLSLFQIAQKRKLRRSL